MGRRRKTGPDRVRSWPSLVAKVPPEVMARLQATSEVLDRPTAQLVREALGVWMDGLELDERQVRLIEEGVRDRLHRNRGA